MADHTTFPPENPDDDYLAINKKLWNDKTNAHTSSEFYDMPSFLAGKSSLKEVELNLLGDVSGKNILHLQCHFGQDSLSLARMGAKVTGVDLSDSAILFAQQLAQDLALDAEFICTDVYNTPEELNGKFDIIFISYGTIGWLPDLERWAAVIHRCLKPQGKLVFVEFHPIVWAFDYEFSKIAYSYFNVETIIETTEGTYTDRKAEIKNKSVSWNHPLSDVFQALLNNNLQINSFEEFDYSPYNCFLNTVQDGPDKYRIKGLEGKIPMLYAITAVKS